MTKRNLTKRTNTVACKTFVKRRLPALPPKTMAQLRREALELVKV